MSLIIVLGALLPMLDTAILFLKEELNSYIKIKTGGQSENIIRFAAFEPPKSLSIENNCITVLLLNLEEERLFKSGASQVNRLSRHGDQSSNVALDLNFHLLFLANFQDYAMGLSMLSLVLKFFRSYRIFSQRRFPALASDIEQLATELVNLTFSEQGELWRSLDMPCSPSVLYKVRMLTLQITDIDDVDLGADIRAIQSNVAKV